MEQAIKLAIEKGGYETPKQCLCCAKILEFCRCGWEKNALDPLFWQALGRALGWNRKAEKLNFVETLRYGDDDVIVFVCRYCGTDAQTDEEHGEYGSVLSSWFVCGDCKGEDLESEEQFIPKHLYHSLRFFELKLTGGDEEKFWKELLTKPI